MRGWQIEYRDGCYVRGGGSLLRVLWRIHVQWRLWPWAIRAIRRVELAEVQGD